MTNIKELEHYFDLVLEDKKIYPIEHPLLDDGARGLAYKKIRHDFGKMGMHLHQIGNHLIINDCFKDVLKIIRELIPNFEQLSSINDENLEYYLRSLAAERLNYTLAGAGSLTPHMLGYLVEGLMKLFFDDGDEVVKLTNALIGQLRTSKDTLEEAQEEVLHQDVTTAIVLYETLEEDLKQAKSGVVAKDRKMISTLRKLHFDLGKNIVKSQMARDEDKRHSRDKQKQSKRDKEMLFTKMIEQAKQRRER